MNALIVVDAQNEFSADGKRPVIDFEATMQSIRKLVAEARQQDSAVAWIRHFNKPNESKAFVPDTWGSAFADGCGPIRSSTNEKEFQKNVYGAFTGTDIGNWLHALHVDSIMIVGFYTHGCVSTTSREAIMRDFSVTLNAKATAACELHHDLLGKMTAEEVKRSALIQLAAMGAHVIA